MHALYRCLIDGVERVLTLPEFHQARRSARKAATLEKVGIRCDDQPAHPTERKRKKRAYMTRQSARKDYQQ